MATNTPAVTPRDLFITGHNGVRLHVLDWGGPEDAPLLVMLHGVGGNAYSFGALAPRVRAPFRMLAVDQRGGGDSDKPQTGYTAEDFAQDVLALQRELGAGKPMVLAGHSRGGWQAAYIAAKWPDRVSHLILVDPARITFEAASDVDDFYGPVRAQLGPFKSREEAFAFGRSRDAEAIWNQDRERTFLFGFAEQPDGSLVGKMPARVLDQLRAERESLDITPMLSSVKVPVLLLVATKSNEKRQQQKLAYAKHLPQARVEFVEGTHHIHIEQADRVASLITETLQS